MNEQERKKLLRDVKRYLQEHYAPTDSFAVPVAAISSLACMVPPSALRGLQSDVPSEAVKSAVRQALKQMATTGFREQLLSLIQKKGLKNAELYRRADITKALFSKIKNSADYHPSKETVIALALGLKLTLDEAKRFLQSAGYALTDSSKTDVIVQLFLKRHIYDVNELNDILYEMNLPPLTKRKETKERKDGW